MRKKNGYRDIDPEKTNLIDVTDSSLDTADDKR